MRAALDIGSSSVLLLVAEYREGEWKRILERREITRLAEGLSNTGRLGEEAMSRTLDTCAELLAEARAFLPERVTAAGTMAFRLAANAEEMLDRLAGIGLEVQVLTPEKEARLAYLAVRNDPTFAGSVGTVVDIGGASTEICSATSAKSYPLGAATLVASILGLGPCSEEEVGKATGLLASFLNADPPSAVPPVVTVGSSGVNLASLLRQRPFDPDAVHGTVIRAEELQELRVRLCGSSEEERRNLLGLEPGREDTVHAGAVILENVLEALATPVVRVSSRGLRWALLD